MSLRTCADCSTRYSVDIDACPHCSSTNTTEDGVVTRRLPLFVTLSCTSCGRGPWTVRLHAVTTGLIELPTLACASCGSRVPVTWPPEEEPMSPKITVHGGATNAHGADVSPVADVGQPLAGAEADQGRPTSDLDEVQVEAEPEEEYIVAEPDAAAVDYESMSLGELRDAASSRGLPTYGTKAQITERLNEADASTE